MKRMELQASRGVRRRIVCEKKSCVGSIDDGAYTSWGVAEKCAEAHEEKGFAAAPAQTEGRDMAEGETECLNAAISQPVSAKCRALRGRRSIKASARMRSADGT